MSVWYDLLTHLCRMVRGGPGCPLCRSLRTRPVYGDPDAWFCRDCGSHSIVGHGEIHHVPLGADGYVTSPAVYLCLSCFSATIAEDGAPPETIDEAVTTLTRYERRCADCAAYGDCVVVLDPNREAIDA